MKRLSVIVPVYNMVKGGRLAFCLDSLVNQTLSDADYEIIAVDDCSTDTSFEMLKDYAARYPALFTVLQTPENLRQGGAKNLGLAYAKGDWIGFVDSDDFVAPSFYEKLLALAEKEGADMAGCDLYRTGVQAFADKGLPEPSLAGGTEKEQRKQDRRADAQFERIAGNTAQQAGVISTEKTRSLILDGGYLPPKIFKRYIVYGPADPVSEKPQTGPADSGMAGAQPAQDLSRVNVFPEKIFYEDNAAGPVWMTRVKQFAYLPEPLYYYYQSGTSTTHTVTIERLKDRMKAAKTMLVQAKREKVFEPYREEFEYRFTQLFYINTLFSAMQAKKLEGCYAFTRAVAKLMKHDFPDFQRNPYYLERTPKEERQLIAMQMRSHDAFYTYYRALWTYRKLGVKK